MGAGSANTNMLVHHQQQQQQRMRAYQPPPSQQQQTIRAHLPPPQQQRSRSQVASSGIAPPMPKKPKGRMSAYTFFVQTCRDEHKRWYPKDNVNFAEFSRKCSARWKLMTEEQKTRFVEMANEDKQRYEAEMATYAPVAAAAAAAAAANQSGHQGAADHPPSKRSAKKKDPHAPKRPLSAFFLFCKDERARVREQHPEASVSGVAKIMGGMWSTMDPELKKKYEESASLAKLEYNKTRNAYKNAQQHQEADSPSSPASNKVKCPVGGIMQQQQQQQPVGNVVSTDLAAALMLSSYPPAPPPAAPPPQSAQTTDVYQQDASGGNGALQGNTVMMRLQQQQRHALSPHLMHTSMPEIFLQQQNAMLRTTYSNNELNHQSNNDQSMYTTAPSSQNAASTNYHHHHQQQQQQQHRQQPPGQ